MEKKGKLKSFLSEHAGEIAAVLILACGLAVYFLWGFFRRRMSIVGAVSGAFAVGMLFIGLAVAAPRAFSFFRGETEPKRFVPGERTLRKGRPDPVFGVILSVLAARVLLLITAYVMDNAANGYHGTVFNTMESIWLRSETDAPGFFAVASSWYSSESSAESIVRYFPLFPAILNAADRLTHSSFLSAEILNTVCSAAAAAVLYKLAASDLGRRSARTAVLFAFAMPAAIFFAAPVSEALFLLLTVCTLYSLRRERFVIAGIFCSLASLTRASGILLWAPFAAEAAAFCSARIAPAETGREKARLISRLTVGAVLALAGAAVYLLIGRLVWGDWFKCFEVFASRAVTPVFFPEAPAAQAEGLLASFGVRNADILALWLPNLLHLFGALAVFVLSARSMRTPYTLYFAVSFAAMCSFAPLYSAPRLLASLPVLPFALAQLCESRDDGVGITRARIKTASVAAVLFIGQFFYLLMFILHNKIF